MGMRAIIQGSDSRAGRAFDLSIQALIVLSIVTFSMETLPDLSEETRRLLDAIETGVVAVFTLEYLLRLHYAEPKCAYACSFFGVVDLLAILPFYLSLGIDLRSLRVLRMLRLFRILKLVRYNSALRRFGRAFALAREELFLFGAVTMMLVYLAAVGIYYFEHEAQPEQFKSIFHSLWWAVATLSTVGYGDIYPITVGGRIFTFLILMLGLGVVAIPAGLLATALTQARQEEHAEAQQAGPGPGDAPGDPPAPRA